MFQLKIEDLMADEWGYSDVILRPLSDEDLRDCRKHWPEHVLSVKPGDWVIEAFDGVIYGREEMMHYLAPSEFNDPQYIEELNSINDMLLRLNRSAA